MLSYIRQFPMAHIFEPVRIATSIAESPRCSSRQADGRNLRPGERYVPLSVTVNSAVNTDFEISYKPLRAVRKGRVVYWDMEKGRLRRVSRTKTSTMKTNCSLCGYLCGLTGPTWAEGRSQGSSLTPTGTLTTQPSSKGCARCRRNLELLDHPMRLNYPMRRVGERGSGQGS